MIKEVLTLSKDERAAHEAKHGAYNALPPNWREVDEKTYVQKGLRRIYSPQMVEFRQAIFAGLDGRETYQNMHMDWFHDGTGSAVVFDYWAGKLRFFFFGCDHKYESIPQTIPGRCIHSSQCTKCGYIMTVDSSD